jgi:hypothetical protein
MTRFMTQIERIARMVMAGTATWDAASSWAERNAKNAIAASQGFSDWCSETYGRLYDGEERAERALERRSLLEFALSLFRGGEAEAWLGGHQTDDVDQDYREQGEQYRLDPPDWVPPTHTWWLWRKK